MSQEITLASSAQSRGGLDLWQGGGALGPAEPPQSPLKKVHRLLRGNYGKAVTLGIICGLLGMMAGWFSQKQKFQSTATIQINPVIQAIYANDKLVPFFDKFLGSQPLIITSQRVIDAAIQSEEWRATGLPATPEMSGVVKANLEASSPKGSQMVLVVYEDADPKVPQAAVRAVVKAYSAMYDQLSGRQLKDKLEKLEQALNNETNSVNLAQSQVDLLVGPYGTEDLGPVITRKLAKVTELQDEIDLAKTQLARFGGADKTELTVQQIAKMDPSLGGMIAEQQAHIDKLDTWRKAGILENSPAARTLAAELATLNERIDSHIAMFREQVGNNRMFDPVKMTWTPVGPDEIDGLNNYLNEKTAALAKANTELQEIGQRRQKIDRYRREIDGSREKIKGLTRNQESAMAEAAGTGTLNVISEGDYAAPSSDNRKKMAFVGFVLGAAIPIGVLMLLGLLKGEYRYSEEASDDMAGMMLLGILPNLPDRLTDPDQAATAAHCVHQIRTMLQINGGDERRVYAVTSASPGDGKTSLTLALGLSFAASGARTLLIDCDLVGGGLTARLDMGGPEGVLEAMSNRALLEYIRTTDVPDLAMLPVGTAQPHHAGMFSPASLRRLVAEAKKHFEVVLIDTGPILGSIEATPVCAAADGVILTVSRGQKRPLVEKAIQHLQSIGAKFAGVVFNRAQHHDFEKSVSGMSLRSVARSHQQQGAANGSGSNGGASRRSNGQSTTIGPVARAVASSVRPQDEQNH